MVSRSPLSWGSPGNFVFFVPTTLGWLYLSLLHCWALLELQFLSFRMEWELNSTKWRVSSVHSIQNGKLSRSSFSKPILLGSIRAVGLPSPHSPDSSSCLCWAHSQQEQCDKSWMINIVLLQGQNGSQSKRENVLDEENKCQEQGPSGWGQGLLDWECCFHAEMEKKYP